MKKKEIVIPLGYEIRIEGNKVILELKESEDERIRKHIIDIIKDNAKSKSIPCDAEIDYLERQKERVLVGIEKMTHPLYVEGFEAGKEVGAQAEALKHIHTGWSEKDKQMLRNCIDALRAGSNGKSIAIDYKEHEKWMESLLDSFTMQKEQKSNIEKLGEISTPADEDWFEIEKKWEAEDNEDLRSFISVKFASNAKVMDGKRFAVLTWERFKDVALEFINRGKEKQKEQKSIEDVIKNITKNKETATKFLKSAGIMDDNGELAEMYRSEQQTAEWSNEDEAVANLILKELEQDKEDEPEYSRHFSRLIDWFTHRFKSLRPQPHQTVEDKSISEEILKYFNEKKDYRSRWYVWVKYASRNPRWKPSKEQMGALEDAFRKDGGNEYRKVINSLYCDLQKLL